MRNVELHVSCNCIHNCDCYERNYAAVRIADVGKFFVLPMCCTPSPTTHGTPVRLQRSSATEINRRCSSSSGGSSCISDCLQHRHRGPGRERHIILIVMCTPCGTQCTRATKTPGKGSSPGLGAAALSGRRENENSRRRRVRSPSPARTEIRSFSSSFESPRVVRYTTYAYSIGSEVYYNI